MSTKLQRLVALGWTSSLLIPTLCLAQDKTEDKPRAAVVEGKRFQFQAKPEALNRITGRTLRVYQSGGNSGLELAEVSEAIKAQVALPEGQGVVVVAVIPRSLADKSGLKTNDLVVAIDDKPIGNVASARELLDQKPPKTVKIKVIRAGKEEAIEFAASSWDKEGEGKNPAQITMTINSQDIKEYWIGVPVSPVDPTLRSHLTELPAKAGIIVNEVVPESPAAKAGLKKNDVLFLIGDKVLTSPDALMTQVRESDGKPLHLEYLRLGKKHSATITPEKHDVLAGQHATGVINLRQSFDVDTKEGVKTAREVFAFTPQEFKAISGDLTALQLANVREAQAKVLTLQKQTTEAVNKEVQAALKELSSKMEEVRKAVDEIRKATDEIKKLEAK